MTSFNVIIAILACFNFTMGTIYGTVTNTLSSLEVEFSLSTIALSGILTSFLLNKAMSLPIFSHFAQWHSKKKVLILLCLLSSLACSILALAINRIMIYTGGLLNGAAHSSVVLITSSILFDTVPRKRLGQYIGVAYACYDVGAVIAAFLVQSTSGSKLFGYSLWRYFFLFGSFATAILGITSFIFLPQLKIQVKEDPKMKDKSFITRFFIHLRLMSLRYKDFLKLKPFLILLLGPGTFATIPISVRGYINLYAVNLGMSNTKVGLLGSSLFLGTSLGSLGGGFLGDLVYRRYSIRGRAILGFILASMASLLNFMMFYSVPPSPESFSTFILLNLFSSFCIPILLPGVSIPMIQLLFSVDTVSYAVGLFLFSTAAADVLGPTMVGFLLEHVFGYDSKTQKSSSNADALRMALLLMRTWPLLITAVSFIILTFTVNESHTLRSHTACSKNRRLGVSFDERTPLQVPP